MSEAKPKPRRKVSKLKSGLPGIEKFSDLMRWKPAERARVLATLTTVEADALYYDWSFWGRPEQKPPPGDWVYWLILAGCGAGKTRSGAEAVRELESLSGEQPVVRFYEHWTRQEACRKGSGIGLSAQPRDWRFGSARRCMSSEGARLAHPGGETPPLR